MVKKNNKPKFNLGQMVWFIRGGCVSNAVIKAMFTHDEETQYTVYSPEFKSKYKDGVVQNYDSHFVVELEDTMVESDMFASKKALIKFIEDQADDEQY